MISIVTVCFNDLESLIQTETSVLEFKRVCDVEWVVVDGGSSDGTLEYLERCNAVDKFVSERDGGIYDAMNKGTLMSAGDYLVYLNAGDILLDANLSLEAYLFAQEKDVDLLFCGAKYCVGNKQFSRRPRSFDSVRYSVPANHQAIFFKRDALGDPVYDLNYKICGDYNLLARMFINGCSHYVFDKFLVSFQLGGVSTFRFRELALEAMKTQKEVLGMGGLSRWTMFSRRYLTSLTAYLWFKLNG